MPRRGENIYKRKDGRWEGRYIRCYDLSHKAQYSSVYAHSYNEVRDKLLKAKNNIQLNKSTVENNKVTLESYSLQWLNDIHSKIKQSTFVKYYNIIVNHIIPTLGVYRIKELSTEIVRRFSDNLLVSGNIKTKGGLSAKSVKDILSVLHLVLNYAGKLGVNSVCNFDEITIKSMQKKSGTISEREHNILVEYLLDETDNVKLGILLCLYTGVRIGEICAMRFKDISLTDNILSVTKTMQRLQTFDNASEAKTSIVISTPKSESSCREIPLPDFISSLIKDMPHEPENYVLTGLANKYIEPRTMENKFKSCLKKCGLDDYNFHQLRHRFATYCVEVGFEIKCLSEILGHSDVGVTLSRYVHSSLKLKQLNMNKL